MIQSNPIRRDPCRGTASATSNHVKTSSVLYVSYMDNDAADA